MRFTILGGQSVPLALGCCGYPFPADYNTTFSRAALNAAGLAVGGRVMTVIHGGLTPIFRKETATCRWLTDNNETSEGLFDAELLNE